MIFSIFSLVRRGGASLFAGFFLPVLLLAASFLAGCATPAESDPDVSFRFTFEDDAEGWAAGFVDYPTANTTGDMQLAFERRALPSGITPPGKALYLAGLNSSDDLFMYLTRKVTGLAPSTKYDLSYQIALASDAGTGCVGVGGAPGEGVYLKVGAAPVEPQPIVQEDWYRLNVDKNNQAADGADAIVIGNVANGSSDCTGGTYRRITRRTTTPFTATTDASGALWLLVGTESGFEGKTGLYYDTITVTLTEH